MQINDTKISQQTTGERAKRRFWLLLINSNPFKAYFIATSIHQEVNMDVSSDFQATIFGEMRSLFLDLKFFEDGVAPQLKAAIADIDRKSIDINFATVKKFAHRYYATGRFVTKEDNDMWKEIQWIFTTCCVLIVSKRSETKELFWESTEMILKNYPTFINVKHIEMDLLLKFRNMVVATLQVVSPRHNKQLILYIAGRLEGTQRRYVTGSGMSEAVKRRVSIYEQEGKVEPEPRPDRINPVIRSIQIRRAEEIRKATAASRLSEGSVKLESSDSLTLSSFELSAVKSEFPGVASLSSAVRMALGSTGTSASSKDPFIKLESSTGKRVYDQYSNLPASLRQEIARNDSKKKSATYETDLMINEQVITEAAGEKSLSHFFNLDPIVPPTPTFSSSTAQAALMPGSQLRDTFGLDVLCVAMGIGELDQIT